MNNYIDVDKLITEIENMSSTDYGSYMDYDVHRGANYMKHDVLTVIDEQPTADVVEVTRCEDCEYRDKNCCKNGDIHCDVVRGYMAQDDWCSYGKRKEKKEHEESKG